MIINLRLEPLELTILRSLNERMELPDKEKQSLLTQQKGYQGELQFDEWFRSLTTVGIYLQNMLFECNQTMFQIDSLFITSNTIYIFEVKNYEGDFFIEGDRWYTLARNEIKNPLLQLNRSENLFRRLLQDIGNTSPVKSYLVFIHPDFQLYQAPLHSPIVFSSQLNRFKRTLESHTSRLTSVYYKLAKKLFALQLSEYPYLRLPRYDFFSLDKGILCRACNSNETTKHSNLIKCSKCGSSEKEDTAVKRMVEDYKLLFPKERVTTSRVKEWCKIIESNKTFHRILKKYYSKQGDGKGTYFI
ncbi:nuclease-related domain-containing protein [Bacillus alkalicellulosilyticus]|uniref:nuclease-related domain-containing protein n=1 Tax=Alkalihalobacterium alkalicellulosilyticum TaxID=1912214 RepID=UPI0014829B4B|nr:nuclease-related domain-containing protein [Bacillus alkalicellulosilyticus]